MRQGSRHGVPKMGGGAQGPLKGRTWPLPLQTPKLGRGAHRAQGESPLTQSKRAV
jgi:hypothetical protein